MTPRVRKVVTWLGYPAFYVFCLLLFAYMTFPFERLRDRILAEFEKTQKPGDAERRLEIDSIDSYWFTGVELEGVRIVTQPSREEVAKFEREQTAARAAAARTNLGASLRRNSATDPGASADGEDEAEKQPPKPTVLTIESAHARARLLPLLVGNVKLDFWASAFGGEVSGVVPMGDGEVEVDVESVELALITPIREALGIPLSGKTTAHLELSAPEGKLDKANGVLELTITDAAVFDGKTKVAGAMSLPQARLGSFELKATAQDGQLKIESLTAQGLDVEIVGDGKITLKHPWELSLLDINVRFKFADAYRSKDDKTKALLGEPGSKMRPLLETAEPKVRRAKRDDGFYAFHVRGTLKKPQFDAASGGGAAGASDAGGTKTTARPNLRKPFARPAAGGASDDDDAGETAAPKERDLSPLNRLRRPATGVDPTDVEPEEEGPEEPPPNDD
jgi:type II secretion system protein N